MTTEGEGSTTTHPSQSLNLDSDQTPVECPTISQIVSDVALYKQVIEDPEKASLVLDNESIKNFTELVGKDLDTPERSLADRFAQLSVEDLNWIEEKPKRYTEEPDGYAEDENASVESDATTVSVTPITEDERQNMLALKLPPEEIVSLLREEFGDLAPPEIEERLLIETDAALVQDVIVLGVIHVTTHRLSFHASLPESRPDLFPSGGVIKSGSAVIHRTGLHRKRRVWLELSQDFLCSFPSASEDDRIRPLKSFLLSSMVARPEDIHHPRFIRVFLSGNNVREEIVLEFDTLEATREWRRELMGAIFLYKHKLMASLKPSDTEDSDGVKISIPLPCIEGINHGRFADLLHLVTLQVDCENHNHNEANASNGKRTMHSEPSHGLQSIQFGIASFDITLDGLEQIVETSKKRVFADDGSPLRTKVIVDYASVTLNDLQQCRAGILTDETDDGSKGKLVCDMLGIPYGPNIWMTQARLHSGPITSGYLVVSPRWIGFWSRSLTLEDEKYRIQVLAIRSVSTTEPWYKGIPKYGLQLDIQGQSSLRFQFRSEANRNDALRKVREAVEQLPMLSPPSTPSSRSLVFVSRSNSPSSTPTPNSSFSAPTTPASPATPSARRSSAILAPISRTVNHPARRKIRMNSDLILRLPKAVNLPSNLFYSMPPMHFVCFTIGSRGDVQPYIALGLGLIKDGHKVTIVTHKEYKKWVEDFGIGHRTAGGDPGQLMKLSVENKMFSPQFFKESILNFRSWLDQLLRDAWEQCSDAQVLLESPYSFAGVHIAEALSIPYFRVCTMPWTKTTQFPHPFISPPVETPKFNRISYVLFDNVIWAATAQQINRWRREVLHLEPTDMTHSAQAKIPIMYNFSSSVVPKPMDWTEMAYPSGYWFLDNPDGSNWTPSPSLLSFMSQARTDGKPLVYIGFGSITVPNPAEVTQRIFAAVVKSGVRAIISKGWSARMTQQGDLTGKPVEVDAVPEECHVLNEIPHDWLFPKVDAALHHGGAGTTSASLRAGIPTLIKPWFGDQFFWASRVQKLGAGLKVPSLRVGDLADALTRATSDRIMKEKAAMVGEKIRSEDGVLNAIQFMYVYLPRATRTAQHLPAESVEVHQDLEVATVSRGGVEGDANPAGLRAIVTQYSHFSSCKLHS
ncbi:unnamed protein product [Somion occarium]|uniref:PH domain-containing protein n=2 Tax=Somion occarium TaxID=3059160 RepID=A0ABP1E2C3_9APHY